MRKTFIFFSFLAFFFILLSSSVLAQDVGFPIRDTVTTIVGTGGSGGEPGPEPGPAPACSATGGSDTDNIDQALKNDFGIKIEEGPPPEWGANDACSIRYPGAEDATCSTRRAVWRIYSTPSVSWKFMNRLLGNPPRLTTTLQFFSVPDDCTMGWAGIRDRIQLKNAAKRLRIDYTGGATWITHETGHIFQQRDSSLENEFDINYFKTHIDPVKKHDDSKCYIGNFLKTYGGIGYDVSTTRESMAEAIALYVYNSKIGKDGTINNFRNECPNTYKWVGDHIFNNVDFGN